MMFINAIVATAILAASTVIAAPPAAVQRREEEESFSIDICKDPGWVGCKPLDVGKGQCFGLATDFDTITGFNTRSRSCTFFVDFGCDGKSGKFQYNGAVGNMLDIPAIAGYNDQISSFICS
ncbi:hypothetical protein LZ554_004488 [Drepanopeziza brunnea f. sp. 'monogermtubi']|nr:hypothetical protein LZ554_004488 [Drepanopeziza brunnea f. sp. 'monogermtubi']